MNDCNCIDDSVTIKDFLLGCAGGYPIEENTLKYICIKQGKSLEEDVACVSKYDRDMLEVEMLRYLLRAPGMTQSVQDTNGTWSHKEGAVEMNSAEKKAIAARLRALESEYGISRSSIKIHNRGMKIC